MLNLMKISLACEPNLVGVPSLAYEPDSVIVPSSTSKFLDKFPTLVFDDDIEDEDDKISSFILE